MKNTEIKQKETAEEIEEKRMEELVQCEESTMKDITNTILDLQNRSVYSDYLKSEYVLMAQDLMITIFENEDNMTLESEEEVEQIKNKLIDKKHELETVLNEFMTHVETLDKKLKKLGV